MITVYIQLDKQNIVRDCVLNYAPGYIMVNTEEPLPIGLAGGWYRYTKKDGFVEIPELNPNNHDKIREEAKEELLIELMERGLI